ncbi:MAG: peptidoglycan-binding protein [Limnothrix sp.]
MEILGLTEAIVWEMELRSIEPTFSLSLDLSSFLNHISHRRSPRFIAKILSLLIAIFSPVLTLPFDVLNPVAIAQTVSCNTLQQGDRGTAVAQLQTSLNSKNYPTGIADGVFGANTEAALKSFQKNNNLDADGIYGPATCSVLNRTSVAIGRLSTSQQLDGVLATKLAVESASNLGANTNSSRTLREGNTGSDVQNLQERLRELGYPIGATAIFDNATENTVRQFQSSQGIQVDGIVGPQTNQRLNNALFNTDSFSQFQISDNGLITAQDLSVRDESKYIVAIPARSSSTLANVRQFADGAVLRPARRGTFVQAGSYDNRELAEGMSYFLRSQGLDARVVTW